MSKKLPLIIITSAIVTASAALLVIKKRNDRGFLQADPADSVRADRRRSTSRTLYRAHFLLEKARKVLLDRDGFDRFHARLAARHTDRIHTLCIDPDLSGGHFLCLFLLQTGRPLQADSEISGETQAHGPVAVPHRTLNRKSGEDASLQSLRKLYPFQLFRRKTGCSEVRQASGSRRSAGSQAIPLLFGRKNS